MCLLSSPLILREDIGVRSARCLGAGATLAMSLLQLLEIAMVEATSGTLTRILIHGIFIEAIPDTLTEGVDSGPTARRLRLLVTNSLVVAFRVVGACAWSKPHGPVLGGHLPRFHGGSFSDISFTML